LRRVRGMAVGAVVLALAGMSLAACSKKESTPGPGGAKSNLKVGLAYDIGGRGDRSFNDSAATGLDKVKGELGIAADNVKELSAVQGETDKERADRLTALADLGFNPIIAVGFAYAPALKTVAPKYPNVHFAIVDATTFDVSGPNVANLTFAEEQGSFLVGAAAALKSKAGHIGFIGGCDVPLIHKFAAGYAAGAKAVNPSIKIESKYLSTPQQACSGFSDPGAGKEAAKGQYDAGADIVYQAAGGSGPGVFTAAKDAGKQAIGVDSDQYQTADAAVKDVIITSMIKHVDVAVYEFVEQAAAGRFTAGTNQFDLKAGGVDYATSGGKIDDVKTKLDGYRTQISDGKITVPTS